MRDKILNTMQKTADYSHSVLTAGCDLLGMQLPYLTLTDISFYKHRDMDVSLTAHCNFDMFTANRSAITDWLAHEGIIGNDFDRYVSHNWRVGNLSVILLGWKNANNP